MITFNKVYSGSIAQDSITETDTFTNADFIFFDTSDPPNEGYELAASVQLRVSEPLDIGSVAFGRKEIQVDLFNGSADTQALIYLPREVSQSKMQASLVLISAETFSTDIYAVSSNPTNDDLLKAIEETQEELQTLKTKANQNLALNVTDTTLQGLDIGIDNIGLLLPLVTGGALPPVPLPLLP